MADKGEILGWGNWNVYEAEGLEDQVTFDLAEITEDGVKSFTTNLNPQAAKEFGQALIDHAEWIERYDIG